MLVEGRIRVGLEKKRNELMKERLVGGKAKRSWQEKDVQKENEPDKLEEVLAYNFKLLNYSKHQQQNRRQTTR